jgi:hypothetical protein
MPLAAIVLIWGLSSAGAPAAPPACAAEDTAFLASLAGEWDVESEFRAGDSWESAPGRASISPDLGGCVLLERYEGTRFGRPYAFLAILGANGGDPAKPIQEVFVHSQHGILSLSSGRIEGGVLAVEDAPTVDGRVVRIRHVYFDVTPRDSRYESRRSTDGGRSWTVTGKARYRRKS